MKNKLIICLAAILAVSCMALSGCEGNKERELHGDDPTTITTKPDEAHFVITETPAKKPVHPPFSFEEGENSLVIENISITAYERIDSESAKKMNKTLDKSRERIEDIYVDDCFRLKEAIDAGEDLSAGFPYKTVVDYSYSRNDGKAITILEKIESYSVDTLSYTVLSAYNFEPLTGELVIQPFCNMENKEDFDNADNIMFTKLNEKYPGTVSYERLGFPSFVDASQSYWQITDSGVKVIFPAGLLAPIESGELEIEYTKEELPEFAQKYFN